MKGNGDGKIEIGVVEMGKGWVMFRAGITPTPESLALKSLRERLREEDDRHYGDEKSAGPQSRI